MCDTCSMSAAEASRLTRLPWASLTADQRSGLAEFEFRHCGGVDFTSRLGLFWELNETAAAGLVVAVTRWSVVPAADQAEAVDWACSQMGASEVRVELGQDDPAEHGFEVDLPDGDEVVVFPPGPACSRWRAEPGIGMDRWTPDARRVAVAWARRYLVACGAADAEAASTAERMEFVP